MSGRRPIRSRCNAPHLRRLGVVVAAVVGVTQPAAPPVQAVGVVQPVPPPAPGSGGPSEVPGVEGATVTTLRVATEALTRLDPGRAPLELVQATVSDLDRQLALVGAKVEASRSELAVAEVDRARLDAAVAETQQRIDALRREVTDQALSMYVAPHTDRVEVFAGSRDLDSSVRRQGLMKTLIEGNEHAVDRLEIARQDLLALQAACSEADARAAALRTELDAGAEQLSLAERRKAEVALSLAVRIEGLHTEVLGHAESEAQLLRILRRADGQAEQHADPHAGQQAEAVVDPPVHEGLSMPIDAAITSEFGARWGRHHDGIDFESDVGVPIHAAEAGLVLEAGWIDGYGLTVVIDHGAALTTLYAHQAAITVEQGERVERGQLVGEVGLTGNTTGPHLHFETREGDVPVDPRKYLS